MSEKKRGRPTDYTPELADEICRLLVSPKSLIDICQLHEMPDKATVYRWIEAHEEFRDKYARAREVQADVYAEEILKIADTVDSDDACDEYGNIKPNHEWIARSKLRVDARKWYVSKVAPKKYGDKMTVAGDEKQPIKHEHLHQHKGELALKTEKELDSLIDTLVQE